MTPRQARIAFGGFLVLAVGVAVNALFLQPGPGSIIAPIANRAAARENVVPARKPQDVTEVKRPQRRPVEERVARLKPDSASVDYTPLPSSPDADTETVAAIQRELKQRGYGPIGHDGLMRDVTRAAIMAFEYDQGLPLLGEASEALLKRILLGTGDGGDGASAGKVRSAHAQRLVRLAQQSLAASGYQPGRQDGQLGEDTRRAIREFELDKGLIPKGRLSAEVLLRLTEATQTKSQNR